jgi:addiction module RelB/DinJ family antitoxin
MGAMAVVETQVDEVVKSRVQQVLDREGLTLSDAFHFFLERTAHENGIPSEVFRPNSETVASMEAARRGEVTPITSFQQLLDEIAAEDEPLTD